MMQSFRKQMMQLLVMQLKGEQYVWCHCFYSIPWARAGDALDRAQRVAVDPPVRVWFSSDGDYQFGDKAKVYAQTARTAMLVVLRADASGQVRVLFPVDPAGDQPVRGGKKYELKGEAAERRFVVGDTTGPRNGARRVSRRRLSSSTIREERALGLQRARRPKRSARRSRSRPHGPSPADCREPGCTSIMTWRPTRPRHALHRVGLAVRMAWLV